MSDTQIRAFLSCSLREQDSPFVENVITLAESHGFLPQGTIGKFTQSPSPLMEDIEEEIQQYDCLIMAATPRYLQEDIHKKTQNKSISEILYVESTIAYVYDKPVLIFVQEDTHIPYFLEGITQYIILPKDGLDSLPSRGLNPSKE
jgi:hypothetical protein